LFSTTTRRPNASLSRSAKMRARMSTLPPGGNPASLRIGVVRVVCASAAAPRL
jgi:hypothetical protein